jgi:hypothetical protein
MEPNTTSRRFSISFDRKLRRVCGSGTGTKKTQSYDAAGSGVTWARGNGGVCLVHAVLLTEFPERESFSPQRIRRELMLDQVRCTLRTLCLTSKSCTDPRAAQPGTWGGADGSKAGHWQAGLKRSIGSSPRTCSLRDSTTTRRRSCGRSPRRRRIWREGHSVGEEGQHGCRRLRLERRHPRLCARRSMRTIRAPQSGTNGRSAGR